MPSLTNDVAAAILYLAEQTKVWLSLHPSSCFNTIRCNVHNVHNMLNYCELVPDGAAIATPHCGVLMHRFTACMPTGCYSAQGSYRSNFEYHANPPFSYVRKHLHMHRQTLPHFESKERLVKPACFVTEGAVCSLLSRPLTI